MVQAASAIDSTNQIESLPTYSDTGSAVEDTLDLNEDETSYGEPITNREEAFYMSRYVQFLGPWFDLFDNSDRHFSYLVPALALQNRLLRLSCLAAAARQYCLVSGRGHGDALRYYDEALRTLSWYLNDRAHEPATFASCLLIAHCEMVESKANDWNLHLKGTRELVVVQGWHGCSGGLAQAVSAARGGWAMVLLTCAVVLLDLLPHDDTLVNVIGNCSTHRPSALAAFWSLHRPFAVDDRLVGSKDSLSAWDCS